MPGAAVPRFDTVTIDCPEPAALAGFYGMLLEWPVPEGDGDFVVLDPPGGGTAITFQRAAGFVAPTWPDAAVQQQLHLDLAVDDLDPRTSGRSPWEPAASPLWSMTANRTKPFCSMSRFNRLTVSATERGLALVTTPAVC